MTELKRSREGRPGLGAAAAIALVAAALFAGFSAAAAVPAPDCISAALTMPQIKNAYMTNPGQKPYAHDPSQVGGMQSVRLIAEYPALSEACAAEYQRLGRAKVQIEVHKGRWRNMATGWPWAWIESNSAREREEANLFPTGHESDWYYWRPGERVRALLQNVVKNRRTGNIEGQRRELVPIQVLGHST